MLKTSDIFNYNLFLINEVLKVPFGLWHLSLLALKFLFDLAGTFKLLFLNFQIS